MKRIVTYTAAVLMLTSLVASCDHQRDLYVQSDTVLHVESEWESALGEPEMMDATLLLYRDEDLIKEYLSSPNHAAARVVSGRYNVVLFNGVMESEEATNLDHVIFKGTNNMRTFEVRVAEGTPLERLPRETDEYIAHNNMSLFACASGEVTIYSDGGYYIKYSNGHNSGLVAPGSVDVRTGFSPRLLSFRFRVRLTGVVNPRSARSAVGAMRGFAGSVLPFASDGIPRFGNPVTHHLTLTTPSGTSGIRTSSDGREIGVVQSTTFTSFGPMPVGGDRSGLYFFQPVFRLIDGTEYVSEPVDITSRVKEAADAIVAHHAGQSEITNKRLFEIEIDDPIVLPPVDPGKAVDVKPWGDDEVIMVWI